MRSRTSRGVSEWSRGKDLYMGSHILGSEKGAVFSVLYREACRRFRRIPKGFESPQVGPPHPKGWHGLRGGALDLLGQAHQVLKSSCG